MWGSACGFFSKDHNLRHETKDQQMLNVDRLYLPCLKRSTRQKYENISEEFHLGIEEMGIAEGACFTPVHLTKFQRIRDGQEGAANMKQTQSSGAGTVWSNPNFEDSRPRLHVKRDICWFSWGFKHVRETLFWYLVGPDANASKCGVLWSLSVVHICSSVHSTCCFTL